MLRRNLDLVTVAILAIAGLVAALAQDLYPLIRGILSVPLLVALPGYALTAALLPDRDSLGRTERTVLGVGMSIVVVILAGLGLNLLPAGITNVTVSVALSAICLAGVVVALARRRGQPSSPDGHESSAAGDEVEPAAAESGERPNRHGPELLALAVILTVAAVFVGVLGAVRAPQTEFTQFSMLPGTDPNVVTVGIRDLEGQPMKYRIEVETQGQVLRSAEIDLGDGQGTSQAIQLPPLTGTAPQTVVARLYRLDQPANAPAYRSTLIWRYPGQS